MSVQDIISDDPDSEPSSENNDGTINDDINDDSNDKILKSNSILSDNVVDMNTPIMEGNEDENDHSLGNSFDNKNDNDFDNSNEIKSNTNIKTPTKTPTNGQSSMKDKVRDTFSKFKKRINNNNSNSDTLSDAEVKNKSNKSTKKGKRQSALAVIKDKTQRLFTPKNNNNNNNNNNSNNGSSKPAKKTKSLVKSKSVYNTVKASKGKHNNSLKVSNNNGNDRSVKNAYKNKSRNRSERKSLQPMKTKDRDVLRARSLTRKNKKTNSLKVNNDDDNGSLSHAHSNKQKSKKKKNQQMRKSDLSMIKKNYNHKSQSLYKNINKGSQLKKTQSIENNDNNNGKLKEYKQKKKVKYRVKNEIFEIFDYYRPIRLIGSGAYAVVCEAIDKRNGKKVAIKKNKHIFDDIRDARRILREIKLLMHFDKHPDIIDLYDTIPPYLDEIESFSDVYIVMPLLESNLCKIITSSQPLTNLHYQYLTYQVLRGLKYIHSTGVIHRDIKPENILLNGKDCDVKIIDFGLARGVLKDEDNRLKEQNTEYVCTRWYRSPEVMCSGGMYDEKMDIWGVGCLLAEMILRRPLFPGNNYMDQLKIIFEIMGTPKTTEWIKNEQAKKWVKKLKPNKGKSLKKMMKNKFDNETDLNNCVDLLYKLLKLSPKERISANKSLKHPYFKDMHDASLATNGQKFDLSFEFEKSIKTKFGVRHMMYESLNQFHVIRKKKKKERKLRKLKQQQMQQQQMQKQTSSSNNNHENQL